ncbi:hypothetical protein KIN20_015022 [Parelaphostrongylus tenuis]|uniref:CULT domain-containing protein n=1 Tax=Parelaphostrongylus tenuis TaxID=148309 RepID=A0AAD5MXZ0_PARTN|nr:hypothetical protein KIN20_015022 [Parelaphostrongylus tenuis]
MFHLHWFESALVIIQVLLARSYHVGELLCRNCGASITRQSELLNITASERYYKYKYDFPVVGKNTTIHVFENPAAETFHVLAAQTAHLKFRGQPSSDAVWFPGMQWTVCVCSKCDHHMGWYFQPEKPNVQHSQQKSFVGLVLDYLISADYVDTVTKVPV